VSRLTVEKIGPEAFHEWDDYVRSNPWGTVFHTTEWLGRINDRLKVFAGVDGSGEVRCGVALVESVKFGVRGYHIPPFTPFFGPLVSSSEKEQRAAARTEEQDAVASVLRAIPGCAHTDFRLPAGWPDVYPFYRAGFTPFVAYTHVFHSSVSEYHANMAKRQRSYLRGMKGHVDKGEVRVNSTANAETVFSLWERLAREKGVRSNVSTLRRLTINWGRESPWSVMAVERADGEPLAGVMLVNDERRVVNLVNASSAGLSKRFSRANLLCLDAAVRKTLNEGKIFDLEGSMLHGVERFYRMLGAHLVPAFRVQKSRSFRYSVLRSIAQFRRERISLV